MDRANKEQELERVTAELEALLPSLGKHKIEKMQGMISKHFSKRFKPRPKIPKYGSLNKGFTEPQLQAFLMGIDNHKFRLLFEFQAYLGLRVGEVVNVRVQDIDFATRELTLRTEKARTLDILIMPLSLFEKTRSFIEDNKKEIEQAQGYLFYTKTSMSQAHNIRVDVNYVRNRFRHYIQLARLDEVYDLSNEDKGRTPRRLHRLTTHSLRHYAITKFARATNGNLILTSRFARHHDPNVTMTYINTDKTELYGAIERAFS